MVKPPKLRLGNATRKNLQVVNARDLSGIQIASRQDLSGYQETDARQDRTKLEGFKNKLEKPAVASAWGEVTL